MIDSTIITDPYIFCLENVLSKYQCKRIIDKFEKNSNQHHQGRTTGGVKLDVKNSTDLQISKHDDWKKEDNLFFNIINTSVQKYFEYLNSKSNLQMFTTGKSFDIFIPTVRYSGEDNQLLKTTT